MIYDEIQEIIEEAVDKAKIIKEELTNHEDLSDLSVSGLKKRLFELDRESEDKVDYRRKYGKLIIHNYTLNKLLLTYFSKKNNKNNMKQSDSKKKDKS